MSFQPIEVDSTVLDDERRRRAFFLQLAIAHCIGRNQSTTSANSDDALKIADKFEEYVMGKDHQKIPMA